MSDTCRVEEVAALGVVFHGDLIHKEKDASPAPKSAGVALPTTALLTESS